MFVIKKTNENVFLLQVFIVLPSYIKTKYEWVTIEGDITMNITIFGNIEDAKELVNDLNQDEEGNKIEMCEVVKISF